MVVKKFNESNSDDVTFRRVRRIRRGSKQEEYSYLELSGDYLNQLVDDKVSIFEEKGRVLKRYLEISNKNPEFDKIGISQRVEDSYKLKQVDIKKEREFIDSYIQNNSIAKNENDFDEFLKHLQLVKLKSEDFSLPIEYVNYIMKQALEVDSVISNNADKYLHLVECAVEDLGKNSLPEKVKKESPYKYFIVDMVESTTLESGQAGGICDWDQKNILIKRDAIRRMIENKDLYVLDAVFHENTHAEQYYDFNNPSMDSYNRYIMQKEEVLRSYFSDFYKDNYSLTYIEIEANEKAAIKLADYIDSLDLSDSSKLNFLYAFGADITKMCEDVVKEKQADYKKGEEKKIDGENKNVVEVFDELIKNNPGLIQDYPQLGMEYHEDGRKRSLKEIFGYAFYLANTNQKNVVSEIIRNGNIMRVDSFLEDMDVLMNAQPKDESDDFLIQNIISENVGRVVREISGNLESMDFEKLSSYKYLIEKIQDRMQVADSFAEGMKKLDSRTPQYEETPIELLQDLKQSIDSLYEKQLYDESEFESIQFLRNASTRVSLDELYDIEREFVEKEEREKRYKQKSRRKKERKKKSEL